MVIKIPVFEALRTVNRYTKSLELRLGFGCCSPAAT